MLFVLLLLICSPLVYSSEPHDHAHEDAEPHSDAGQHMDSTLTEEQRLIYGGLNFGGLLSLAEAEDKTLNTSQITELMLHISAGRFMKTHVEEASDGEISKFLFLTPDLILDEYGDGLEMTRAQFKRALPAFLSCIARSDCALATDTEFIGSHEKEDHDHESGTHMEEHGHEEHSNKGDDHEEHEEHEEHDNHEEHEDHEDHDDNDDDTFNSKLVALSVLFFEAIVGALVPTTLGSREGFNRMLSLLNCFAGGVLLSTGIIHLIPHVVEYEEEADIVGDYPLGMVLIVASFVLVFYVEHVLFDVHSHQAGSDDKSEVPSTGDVHTESHSDGWKHCLVLLMATAVHSILEALVLGLEDDSYSVWLLFASIAGHKGVTAMALSARFFKANIPTLQALGLALLFSITAPISVLIGTTLNDVPAMTNLILTALSTGTFLYIGAYEVISEEFQQHPVSSKNTADGTASRQVSRHVKSLAVLCGVLVIAGVAFIPHADHDHGDGHGH